MYEEYSELFKVLSDPNRIKIIELLIQGETCGCNLVDKLPISQPTLSHHLKRISSVGLVTSFKEGNKVNYCVNKEKITELVRFLETIRNSETTECST